MKKKEISDDLEIYIDPKPLTKEEEIALSLFIRQLKEKKAHGQIPAWAGTRKTSKHLQKK